MTAMVNRRIDDWGRVIMTDAGILELFYQDKEYHGVISDNTEVTRVYNSWCDTFDKVDNKLELFEPLTMSCSDYHKSCQDDWLIPQAFLDMNIEEYLLAKCSTIAQIDRVRMELVLFNEHRMVSVLRLMVYMVDEMRSNDVVWGVGRGSSVASYILFLIGIHRIDSLMYDLDIREFIKE